MLLEFFAFLSGLSLFLIVPLLAVLCFCTAWALYDSRRRSYGWAVFCIALILATVHFRFKLDWIVMLKYSGYYAVAGLFYFPIKYFWEVKKYHIRLVRSLDAITEWPIVHKQGYGTYFEVKNFSGCEIGESMTEIPEGGITRAELVKKFTPQFNQYKKTMAIWIMFWPFCILADLSPFKWIENMLDMVGKYFQNLTNKMFQEA